MRHATATDLDRLEPLLRRLRNLTGLKEKSRGTFYRGSRAFLHFHADGAALYADIRTGEEFERVAVTTTAQKKALLTMIGHALSK